MADKAITEPTAASDPSKIVAPAAWLAIIMTAATINGTGLSSSFCATTLSTHQTTSIRVPLHPFNEISLELPLVVPSKKTKPFSLPTMKGSARTYIKRQQRLSPMPRHVLPPCPVFGRC